MDAGSQKELVLSCGYDGLNTSFFSKPDLYAHFVVVQIKLTVKFEEVTWMHY